MVQAVWFDAGSTAAGRLLLSIHHLAVDGVSWRILVPELAAAWEAIAQGRVPAAGRRGTSFRGWAQRLALQGAGRGAACGAFVLERDAEQAVARCLWMARSMRAATWAARPAISRSRCRRR